MSLIEVVVFIVVLGIGIAGTVVLFNQVTESSVDPVVRKQTLAIAASLLEEIELRPFTTCDPDDPNVFGPGPCTTPEVIGPDGETRYAAPGFDNVNDYHGFSMAAANIRGADGTFITGLGDYAVDPVTVQNAGGVAPFAGIPADEVLLITVTARHMPTGVAVSLQGYRFRYAPNSP